MEKYYIVKNTNFQNQIKVSKENERNQKKFIRDFFDKNGITGNAYYLGGTGFCDKAFWQRGNAQQRITQMNGMDMDVKSQRGLACSCSRTARFVRKCMEKVQTFRKMKSRI